MHRIRMSSRSSAAPRAKKPSPESLSFEEVEDAEEEEHQLAMPGTSFAPPVVSFDPLDIEADETNRKRRQAGALMDAIKVRRRLARAIEPQLRALTQIKRAPSLTPAQTKQAKKFSGKKVGGGTTNKEKARKKNFLMLRKSSAVQGKLRRSLKEQSRVLTKKIRGDAKMDKRKKQRRRRT